MSAARTGRATPAAAAVSPAESDPAPRARELARETGLDVGALHRAHAGLVWKTLHRLGVADADLPDQLQEVFLVAHRRRAQFDGTSKPTTWLFGIALRVAADYRRSRRRKGDRQEPYEDLADSSGAGDPEASAQRRDAVRQLGAILDTMDLERRVAFTLFELEQLSCAEIAELCAVPVGTVYSRLHAARRQFADELAKLHARGAHRGGP